MQRKDTVFEGHRYFAGCGYHTPSLQTPNSNSQVHKQRERRHLSEMKYLVLISINPRTLRARVTMIIDQQCEV